MPRFQFLNTFTLLLVGSLVGCAETGVLDTSLPGDVSVPLRIGTPNGTLIQNEPAVHCEGEVTVELSWSDASSTASSYYRTLQRHQGEDDWAWAPGPWQSGAQSAVVNATEGDALDFVIEAWGNGSRFSNARSVTVTCSDDIPPPPPADGTVDAQSSCESGAPRANLNWSALEGVTYYRVLRNGAHRAWTSSLTFDDTTFADFSAGTTVTYDVEAYLVSNGKVSYPHVGRALILVPNCTGQATNQPPSVNANATPDTITLPADAVFLNAAANDPDGTIVGYQWTKVSGPGAHTFNAPTSSLTVAGNLNEGLYVFRVTVTDDDGAQAQADVSVTVNPQPQNCQPETCDGVDNDCDGQVDEGLTNLGTCDGADADMCRDGMLTCSAGALVCTDNSSSVAEICGDTIDNDCDGQVNEGCSPQPPNGSGLQVSTNCNGTSPVISLQWSAVPNVPYYKVMRDGAHIEWVSGGGTTYVDSGAASLAAGTVLNYFIVGPDSTTTQYVPAGDAMAVVPSCTGPAPNSCQEAEFCGDRLDNDCDGQVDEGCSAPPVGSGWPQSHGGTSADQADAIATDSRGNVVVAGLFLGNASFGGATLTANNTDIFIAKYTPTGAHLWSKRVGGVANEAVQNVSIDRDGNIVVAGTYLGSSTNLGGATMMNRGGYDGFIAKYSATGRHLWSISMGDTKNEDGFHDVAFDASGNVVFAGRYRENLDSLVSGIGGGGTTTIVGKLSATTGQLIWARRYGAKGNGYADGTSSANGVAVDASGNVLVAGSYFDALRFGSIAYLDISGSYSEIFVAKLSGADGEPIWAKSFGGSQADSASRIALDATGNAYVVGEFVESASFGSAGTLTDSNATSVVKDVFLLKVAGSTGNPSWVRGIGSANFDEAGDLAVSSSGEIAVTGSFRDSLRAGGLQASSSGSLDVFVAWYSTSGTVLELMSAGGSSSDDYGWGIAHDNGLGRTYVTGRFRDTATMDGVTLTSAGSTDFFIMGID